MVLLGAAVQSQLAQALRDSSVRSNHHPAIAPGTEILTRKERKAGHPAQLAGHAPLAVDLAACPDRLSGVLDDLHIARPRQRQQPLQRGHLPVQVHRHDRPGARVHAAATAAGSMLKVSGSTSTKTGVPPALWIAPAVAKNANRAGITSSPGSSRSAFSP